jgi:hypothetical protein
MSKYYVEKYVKIPVLVEVDADDEFGALNNIAYGDYDSFEYTDDAYDWVIDGIIGKESIDANYTIIYDKKYKVVRRMTNEVAASYIN